MEFHKPRFKKKTYGDSRNDRSSGYGGPRNDRSSGYGGPRSDRSSGYRGPRDDRSSRYGGQRSGGSRFSRGSENSGRTETTTVTCGDCGKETQIPFKPKYDRPVYCRECFQDHKPQEHSGGSGFNRGSSYGRNDRSSRYNRDSRSGGSRFSRGSRDERSNEMFTATCGDCGDECQIPFKPRDNRPVYCRECFQDHKPQESSSDSRFNRSSRYDQGSSKFKRDRTPIHRRGNIVKTKFMSNDDDSKSFYSSLRKKLFSILGEKKCVNCGFEDERALGFEQTDDVTSFDFIQRGGASSSWEKYISDPDLAKQELQIICLNCNMIKQKESDK